MPTIEFLKRQFPSGFDSGDILAPEDARRQTQEEAIGGSYQEVFRAAILPYVQRDSTVLELGPGAGSWSRSILSRIPEGTLHAVDFQNVAQWLDAKKFAARLVCHQVQDNSFSCIGESSIDYFWSFGVLCHNNKECIREILENSISRMKPGAVACHQYGDWQKLDRFGWENTIIPPDFKTKTDDEIWWPRNSAPDMKALAEETGWTVLTADLDLLKRDGLILLQNPDCS